MPPNGQGSMNTALCRARPGSPNVSHVVGYSEQDDKSLKYSGHTGSFFRELFGKSSIRMQKDNEEGVSAPPPHLVFRYTAQRLHLAWGTKSSCILHGTVPHYMAHPPDYCALKDMRLITTLILT